MGTQGHSIRSMSKYSRRLQSQTGRPLGPIKTSLLGRSVTTKALTTKQRLESRTTYIRTSHHQQKVQEIYTNTTLPIFF